MVTFFRRILICCALCAMNSCAAATEPASDGTGGKRDAQSVEDFKLMVLRAQRYSDEGQHAKAVEELTTAIQRNPDNSDVVNFRGSERLLCSQFSDAIADFDRYLEKNPNQKPYHWKRGIALYYAGRYDDGVKQFDLHQSVNPADVENAVWRYLCMVKRDDVETAQKNLLKIGADPRVPMKEIYDLFSGNRSVDVLRAAQEHNPGQEELRSRLFYAHLYLGLFSDAQGDVSKSIEHLKQALEKYSVNHYMGEVAKVHLRFLTDRRGQDK
jgi:lipoprotein NlpI